MKNYERYFQKNNFLYGVSYKEGKPKYVKKFDDLKLAKKWLNTKVYDQYRTFVFETEANKIKRRLKWKIF